MITTARRTTAPVDRTHAFERRRWVRRMRGSRPDRESGDMALACRLCASRATAFVCRMPVDLEDGGLEEEGSMARFVLGVVVGLALGLGGTAMAANIVGGDSFLSGWDVTKNG